MDRWLVLLGTGFNCLRLVVRAFYDLRTQPASFDFWIWLSVVSRHPIEAVAFDTSRGFKYQHESQAVQRQLFENVVCEICELFEIEVMEDKRRPGDVTARHVEINPDRLALPWFELDPTGPPTVTLRDTHKHRERNSDRSTWLTFADRIGATVIEDAFAVPITIKDRLELYRRAPMNYGMANGPLAMAVYSNLPVRMWMPDDARPQAHIPAGTQYEWFGDDQAVMWEDATPENLSCIT